MHSARAYAPSVHVRDPVLRMGKVIPSLSDRPRLSVRLNCPSTQGGAAALVSSEADSPAVGGHTRFEGDANEPAAGAPTHGRGQLDSDAWQSFPDVVGYFVGMPAAGRWPFYVVP